MSEAIQWAKLTPEERDRLVAEKVMGWTEKRCEGEGWDIVEYAGGWGCTTCGFQGDWMEEGAKAINSHLALPPRYSQSMDAAWEVLKHMCHEPEWTEPMMLFINYLDDGVDAVIDRNATRLEPIFTLTRLSCLTPEIICLAALKSLGVEIEL